jgi:hypothetical protein
MNHLQKIFSSCSVVPYSVFEFVSFILSHDYVCMKVAAAIGPASIPWMINDLGITDCVTATGENHIAV